MLVGIHKYKDGYFPLNLEVYEKILAFNEIPSIRMDVNETDFWEKLKSLDLFIFPFYNVTDLKEIAWSIMPVINNYLNIKCFPDLATSWHYDDKIKEYYLLKQLDLPVIPSYIFWEKSAAMDWVEKADFPVVFKLKTGSGSKNVLLVENPSFARKLTRKMFGKGIKPDRIRFGRSTRMVDFSVKEYIHQVGIKIYRTFKGKDLYPLWEKQKNYILFQKYLPDNHYDIRINVVGNRAFGGIRYNRVNDFRASGSGLPDNDHTKIDTRCVEIAFLAADKLNFQSMAFDFLFDERNEPMISEISYIFPSYKGGYLLEGYWDRKLKWHPGHFWPQYFQLMDLLNMPGLKQPEIPVQE
jgi:glutathione synthase/RimK-type ligase-like ATP-grasp enzyme